MALTLGILFTTNAFRHTKKWVTWMYLTDVFKSYAVAILKRGTGLSLIGR